MAGIDGSEENAGAVVTPDSLKRALGLGLKAANYLARNDVWSFFDGLSDLITTEPTLTNVNDFRAVLVLQPVFSIPALPPRAQDNRPRIRPLDRG